METEAQWRRVAAPLGTVHLPPQLVEPPRDHPVVIDSIHYGLLSADAIHRLSVLPCRRVIGPVGEFGVNDTRLGVCDRKMVCGTCGQRSVDCVGHAGHIDLEAPVFHLGFFSVTLRICRTICKKCSHVLLTEEEIEYYARKLRSTLEPEPRLALVKQIYDDAYKTRACVHCGGLNGTVRCVRPLRIVHEKYRTELRRGEVTSEDSSEFFQSLQAAAHHNKDVGQHPEYIHEFLDPFRVRQLFLAIPAAHVLLLGFRAGTHPVDLLITSMLVPPVSVRPRGVTANQFRDDDLTTQYNEILISSDALKDGSNDVIKYVENWDNLQIRAARLLDSAVPGFPAHLRSLETKSYAQRMKGKHGRFRANLSGKRVDFSGRSVISPDPNLDIDELAVPLCVARVLTYPQRVFPANIDLMRRLVRNGPNVHPGAITIFFAGEKSRKSLHNARDRESLATRLAVGDIVERHIMNGDMILFNRQPSLHRISMMAHRARVLPHRTFRFNECCCSPYNADFDGDEMNVHVVQTEEARAEAQELMLAAKNIISARNGEPIIACIQDFLTAAYLVTSKDAFFDRSQFTWMVSHWLGPTTMYDLPIPALLKPVELWTGKQLFELIVRPSWAQAGPLLNLEAKTRFYSGDGKHNNTAEGFVAFLDSVYISGRLDKKLLGGGAKDGLFSRLYALTGGRYTSQCMSRIAQFTSRYLQNYGFSFGLGDVAPTPSLNAKKSEVLAQSFAKCDVLIQQANSGRLVPLPGLTVKQSLEARLNSELSLVRDTCGSTVVDTLDGNSNAPLIMVNSGSKGSALNTAQMMACVGQQTVNGKRIVNAFLDRALPHFHRFSEDPAARGFVASSFFSGLSPTEFFFHTMAGREGLVDTAVKTSETGYIYRRLSKAMENLSVQYDSTVRNPRREIVQMRYGEDGLDPWQMEGSSGSPLNLDQEWLACRAAYARTWRQLVNARTTIRSVQAGRVAEALVPEVDFVRSHVLSLLPDAVVPFVEACLGASGEIVKLMEKREAQESQQRAAAERIHNDGSCVTGDHQARNSTDLLVNAQPCQTSGSAYTTAAVLRRFAAVRSDRFVDSIRQFMSTKVKEQMRLRKLLELPAQCYSAPTDSVVATNDKSRRNGKLVASSEPTAGMPECEYSCSTSPYFMESLQTQLLPLTEGMLCSFIVSCVAKYLRKMCEPGTPCGAIAAQSVGEPSTQMTLRTFHFAGVASMSITQGVPRLEEIINANKSIATPVITVPILAQEGDMGGGSVLMCLNTLSSTTTATQRLAHTCRAVKGLLERVLLKEVAKEMAVVVTSHSFYIQIHLHMHLIQRLLLPINAVVVRQRILMAAARPMSPLRQLREDCVEVISQDALIVRPYVQDVSAVMFNIQSLLTLLPEIVVGGIAGITRAMMTNDGTALLAEGAELRDVMVLPHVDGTRTKCNHVAVMERVLGIEAARSTIINEIQSILNAYSLSIDVRHVYLLADVMTHRGTVLGITRYGIHKMNPNVLTMASFERTTDHLYDAAVMQRVDSNLSVSESIIVGKPIPLGTSSFSLLLAKGSAVSDATTGSKKGIPKSMGPSMAMLQYRAKQRLAALKMEDQLVGRMAGNATAISRYMRGPLSVSGTFRVDLFT